MNSEAADRFLDRAEQALRSSYGGRRESETAFLQHLLRDVGSDVSALSPAELFRAVSCDRPWMDDARDVLEVLAMPSQRPESPLRPGDLMLRAVPGTGDVGHVAVLASDDLLEQSMLAPEGMAAESVQPGQYGLVIEAGAFPHSRSQPFARRWLDNRGRVPPHTMVLRPKYSDLEAMADLRLDERLGETVVLGPSATLGEPTPRVLTYTTKEVIDDRISVPAQHSLVRLSKNPTTSADAVGMLEEIKAGRLAGIYCVNWKKAALRARRFGESWWTVIPASEDAVLMLDPDNPAGGQPLIAFRRELDPRDKGCGKLKTDKTSTPSPEKLDAALLKAWASYKLWQAGQLAPCDVPLPGGQVATLASAESQPSPGIPVSNVVPPTFCRVPQVPPEIPPGPVPPIPPTIPPQIIPVIDRPLKPDRWASLLSAAMSTAANLRTGNAVRTLIDGEETFEEMVSDIRLTQGEKDYIYLLAWDITDDFPLIPRDRTTTVRQLLADASARGVQIRAMLWAKPPGGNKLAVARINALPKGAAIRDDETANKTPLSVAALRAALVAAGILPQQIPLIIPLIALDLPHLVGAHHQKVLIVKRGEILVAYCGGIDINRNRLKRVNPSDPHHDTHCRIAGPSAWDLLQTFIKRWRHHPDSAKIDSGTKGPLRGGREGIPAPIGVPLKEDAPFGGTTSVIIARTFDPTRAVPGVGPERDIKALLLTAIRNANRFIYMEDQYLIDLDTADALNRAMPNLKHLTILITGSPLITGSAIPDLPFGREYRRDFVNRLTAGLSPTDAAKIGIFQLSSLQSQPTFGKHTYVHSKTWVFDDELVVIGSANCNRRGYQHDSEVDAFIFDDFPVGALGLTFAQQYRMRLWKRHLGVSGPGNEVVDGVASAALWRASARPTTARVLPFDHRLPSNAQQTIRDIAADKLRFLIDPKSP